MQTFQKPLSEQEELYYLTLLRAGDTNQKKEARQILIERNLRLVAHIVKKYQNVGEDVEDLISIGTIGLIKAIASYDEGKGSRLATYAARCIDNELLMMLRMRKKSAKDVSIYEPIGTDKEGNEINLLDVTLFQQEDFAQELQKREDIQKIRQLVETVLPPREKEIITLRYGFSGEEELTQREIGERLGISRSYVSRIEKKALAVLKAAFEKNM
ncbi:MAG: sigma-70 family RNA polymerase sigma factor [Lachnospiraceae bacterium]|nr:sigma-70 family RNA polymerase sigma factor [Lachnospiraceae bacterium]